MTSNANTKMGEALTHARKRVGLTRTRLAALVGCSTTSLANIEDGAIPKRSAVLERALAVIAAHEDERPAAGPGAVTTSARGASRHAGQ